MICSICLERFNYPVSLPCGHVFCQECIRRTVHSTQSTSNSKSCPTCRATFSILNVDPALIPAYLRPHIQPPLRPLFLEDSPTPNSARSASASTSRPTATAAETSASSSSISKSAATTPTPHEPAGPELVPATSLSDSSASSGLIPVHPQTLAALNLTISTHRRRAALHASANTNLLAFARTARDCALRMRAERDQVRNECVLLKKRLGELQGQAVTGSNSKKGEAAGSCAKRKYDVLQSSGAPAASDPSLSAEATLKRTYPPEETGLPLFVMQFHNHAASRGHEAGSERNTLDSGPPMKRRRTSSPTPGEDTAVHDQ
ncbi:hypothetical protein FB45DRAFT_449763 [Roridomyces roridus]|uniref:RING-type domain-containing protein n=1 Tax=Roridomyces roridus TaxID=1738132 RepID=A0AAD7C297_9AGAR|nr:hypothetical protein FB45DRAFT_449763 [Roridomyces roridus]